MAGDPGENPEDSVACLWRCQRWDQEGRLALLEVGRGFGYDDDDGQMNRLWMYGGV